MKDSEAVSGPGGNECINRLVMSAVASGNDMGEHASGAWLSVCPIPDSSV